MNLAADLIYVWLLYGNITDIMALVVPAFSKNSNSWRSNHFYANGLFFRQFIFVLSSYALMPAPMLFIGTFLLINEVM
jgi:hypothetical protein